jgi:hypothetical protein
MRGALVALALLMTAKTAFACSCMDLLIEEKVDRAAHIFRARVTSAELVEKGPEGSGRVKAQFEIVGILKGTPSDLDGVFTPTGGGSCEVPIIVGLEYVFFASTNGEVNSCGGTMPRRGIRYGDTGEWLDFVRRYGLGPD